MIMHPTIREGSGQEGQLFTRAAILETCAATSLAGRTWLQIRHPVELAKVVEGPSGTSTVIDMTSRNHMSAILHRASALFAFGAVLWVVQVVNWITGYGLNPTFGLIPRYLSGLDGIITMPLPHGIFAHLMANTPPLLLMGGLLVATTTLSLLSVNTIVVGLGGGLIWLFGSSTIHFGASGLIFGWFGFLVTRGFVDRSLIT